MKSELAERLTRVIRQQGSQPCHVLEVGVGVGNFTRLMARSLPHPVAYSCCDLDKSNIERAKAIMGEAFESGHHVDFTQGMCSERGFDVIVTDTALNMNAHRLDSFFLAGARLLRRPHGTLLLRDLAAPTEASIGYDAFMKEYVRSPVYQKLRYTFVERRRVSEAAEAAGLQIHALDEIFDPNAELIPEQWGFVSSRPMNARGMRSLILEAGLAQR